MTNIYFKTKESGYLSSKLFFLLQFLCYTVQDKSPFKVIQGNNKNYGMQSIQQVPKLYSQGSPRSSVIILFLSLVRNYCTQLLFNTHVYSHIYFNKKGKNKIRTCILTLLSKQTPRKTKWRIYSGICWFLWTYAELFAVMKGWELISSWSCMLALVNVFFRM